MLSRLGVSRSFLTSDSSRDHTFKLYGFRCLILTFSVLLAVEKTPQTRLRLDQTITRYPTKTDLSLRRLHLMISF